VDQGRDQKAWGTEGKSKEGGEVSGPVLRNTSQERLNQNQEAVRPLSDSDALEPEEEKALNALDELLATSCELADWVGALLRGVRLTQKGRDLLTRLWLKLSDFVALLGQDQFEENFPRTVEILGPGKAKWEAQPKHPPGPRTVS